MALFSANRAFAPRRADFENPLAEKGAQRNVYRTDAYRPRARFHLNATRA